MVRPVSLSDPAFAELRKEKRPGESDSDVVLRVIREARRSRKDPMHFVRVAPRRERAMSFEQQHELLRKMAAADRRKAERMWRQRRGRA